MIKVEIMNNGWKHHKSFEEINEAIIDAKQLSEDEVTLTRITELKGNGEKMLYYFKNGNKKPTYLDYS